VQGEKAVDEQAASRSQRTLHVLCMLCMNLIPAEEHALEVYGDAGLVGYVHEPCFDRWIKAPDRAFPASAQSAKEVAGA